MSDQIRHLAGLILARGGSKGIPRKNIKLLHGIPLIGWTLRAAIDANCFNSLWVSTEDEEIADIAKHFGALVHFRSAEFVGDEVSSIDSLKEFLGPHDDVSDIGLLQCTSPCVQPSFIRRATTMLMEEDYDSVFAVSRDYHLRWRSSSGTIAPLNFDPHQRPRRQDWHGELLESGMFYFASTKLIHHQNTLQGGKCGFVEIPQEYSLDIDSPYDWLIAETIVPLYGYQKQRH